MTFLNLLLLLLLAAAAACCCCCLLLLLSLLLLLAAACCCCYLLLLAAAAACCLLLLLLATTAACCCLLLLLATAAACCCCCCLLLLLKEAFQPKYQIVSATILPAIHLTERRYSPLGIAFQELRIDILRYKVYRILTFKQLVWQDIWHMHTGEIAVHWSRSRGLISAYAGLCSFILKSCSIIIIIIIIKLFKGIHKRHVPVQGDTLTYNPYSYKNTITKTEQHTQYKYRIKQSH